MKKDIYIIITSIFLTVTAMVFRSHIPLLSSFIFLAAYIIAGFPILKSAFRNIRHGEVFDENFLMCIASIGAFAIKEYPEAIAVMLLYRIGEMFQHKAVSKSKKSIANLMNIRPDYANVSKNGEIVVLDPELVEIDDIIIIRPGEKIPVDGIVTEGQSIVDTSALTGESMPKDISVGEEVISGCINLSGLLTVRATKQFEESTVNKILDLVENSSEKKSIQENFITRFSKIYTPFVVGIAILMAIIPPILLSEDFSQWIYRSLVFLVVSCPCALVISVPLSFFAGIGGASRQGILIKGGNYLSALSKVQTVVFDKTGTLTKGIFTVNEVHANDISTETLLYYAALAESFSNHPIAKSIVKEYGKELDHENISFVNEVAGRGVHIVYKGENIIVGNSAFMTDNNVDFTQLNKHGTVVYVAKESKYLGYLLISDKLKDDAKGLKKALNKAGVKKVVMLTGDRDKASKQIADELSFDEYYSELLPSDKVYHIESILEKKPDKGGTVAFVGDGINDAPVLARADIGISMGALGSDAAIEASDIVIMDDKLSKLPLAISISKKTLGIANINIIISLIVKFSVLILGFFNIATMWAAVFADVGVTLIAVFNSMRALTVNKEKTHNNK